MNAERYPNIDIINDFEKRDYAVIYHFVKQLREKLYGNCNDLMISLNDFKTLYPLFVFDVSRQSERLKNSVSDITIKANFHANVADKTKCYCLIMSDRILKLASDGNRMYIQ